MLNQFSSEWTVPADLPFFNGHFPGHPVLPAVCIIDRTVEILRDTLKLDRLRLSRVVSAKFLSPVLPNTKVEISFQRVSDFEWKAEWRPMDDSDPSGKLRAELRLHF